MRGFYRAWPEQEILQTSSGEFAIPLLSAHGSPLLNLSSLAARFPLPWSAYVRLLSVKNEDARKFYESEALRAG